MWDQVKDALYQSTTRFLTGLASLLPGMVAAILALLISFVLAWVLAVAVRRMLSGMQFDELLVRWGFTSVGEWSPTKSPTLLVARAVACFVIFTGFLIGFTAFNADLTSSLVRSIFAYIPNILGATLVLLVGSFVASFLGRTVLIEAVNMNLQYARLLSAGVKWLVTVLAIAMALEHLRIAPGIVELAFGILFGGIVFALALGIGLSSKDFISKSFDRDAKKTPVEDVEEPFRHV